MDRVFLDANVIFSAAYRPAGKMKKLWQLARAGKIELISSIYAVEEAGRNLDKAAQLEQLEKILRQVEIGGQSPGGAGSARLAGVHEKDRPIIEAAIAMQATHLVTGNFRHFRSLYGKRTHGLLILPPRDYLMLK